MLNKLINKYKSRPVVFADGGRMIPKNESGWWKTGVDYSQAANRTHYGYARAIYNAIRDGNSELASRINFTYDPNEDAARAVSRIQKLPGFWENFDTWGDNGRANSNSTTNLSNQAVVTTPQQSTNTIALDLPSYNAGLYKTHNGSNLLSEDDYRKAYIKAAQQQFGEGYNDNSPDFVKARRSAYWRNWNNYKKLAEKAGYTYSDGKWSQSNPSSGNDIPPTKDATADAKTGIEVPPQTKYTFNSNGNYRGVSFDDFKNYINGWNALNKWGENWIDINEGDDYSTLLDRTSKINGFNESLQKYLQMPSAKTLQALQQLQLAQQAQLRLQQMLQQRQSDIQSNTNTWNKYNTGSSGRHQLRNAINQYIANNGAAAANLEWSINTGGSEQDMLSWLLNNNGIKNGKVRAGALRRFNKAINNLGRTAFLNALDGTYPFKDTSIKKDNSGGLTNWTEVTTNKTPTNSLISNAQNSALNSYTANFASNPGDIVDDNGKSYTTNNAMTTGTRSDTSGHTDAYNGLGYDPNEFRTLEEAKAAGKAFKHGGYLVQKSKFVK